jgi:hypothetical protein
MKFHRLDDPRTSATAAPRLCKDCHHYNPQMLTCDNAPRPGIDYVHGQTTGRRAQYEREDERPGACGPSALHFKPREPF